MADMGLVGLRDVFVVGPPHHEPILCSGEHPIIPLLAAAPLPVQNPTASSGSSTCQDCGNQAKKDCIHRRCRTCCKSRGFDCSTHVKSTWVPAARRRERQINDSAAAASNVSPKKPRLISSQTTTNSHTSTSNTPPRSFETSSSNHHHHHQEGSFRENLPGQVRAPAVFKCVRVTSVDDGEDEYAYQAIVNIGGHVFKGFLYDQGVDELARGDLTAKNSSAVLNISELHLGAGRSAAASPSELYGGAAAFGNTIN